MADGSDERRRTTVGRTERESGGRSSEAEAERDGARRRRRNGRATAETGFNTREAGLKQEELRLRPLLLLGA